MANPHPKIENLKKFSSTYQPKHNGRHKGKSPATCLRELMNDNIPYLNPITGVKEVDSASYACAIKLLVKWLQDEDLGAGKEIFDRIDGKQTNASVVVDQSQHTHFTKFYLPKENNNDSKSLQRVRDNI